MPAPSCTMPYEATGAVARSASAIHAVANGTSDSQNSRCMFAQSTAPLMRSTTCRRWWWLFQ